MLKRKPGRPPAVNGKTARVMIRLPEALHNLIVGRAKANRRTKSAELLLAIERGLSPSPMPLDKGPLKGGLQ